MVDDTIAAISTPLGEGGLAVIRLSGERALAIMKRCFVPSGKTQLADVQSHTLHHGHIVKGKAVVDEVMVAVMRAPRTFTREDVVEISCHGGLLPAKMVLEVVMAQGARLALPGEFTKRAFLNGRIDLAQAEAVADLIHSRTELALAAANEQLAGKLSLRINKLRDELMHVLAQVEAHIDFPEEDIAPDGKELIISKLDGSIGVMDELLRTANEGQILRRGIRVAIVGRPNVGKSSILNHLLGHDRAIVSAIPGTTRDTIEETANIRGIPVIFIDTAGLREAGDEIEEEGIRRSRVSMERAELILYVFDNEGFPESDFRKISEKFRKIPIIIENKIDLRKERGGTAPGRGTRPTGTMPGEGAGPTATTPCRGTRPTGYEVVEVSCVTGEGLERLKDCIKERIWSGEVKAEMLEVMINARHQEALRRARGSAVKGVEGLREGLTLELVAMDLRMAANAVGEVVGKTTTEDLLDSIFSQFCIGK